MSTRGMTLAVETTLPIAPRTFCFSTVPLFTPFFCFRRLSCSSDCVNSSTSVGLGGEARPLLSRYVRFSDGLYRCFFRSISGSFRYSGGGTLCELAGRNACGNHVPERVYPSCPVVSQWLWSYRSENLHREHQL